MRVLVLLAAAATLHAAKTVEIYFIDVEGGQSTLIVSPSGESLLVDAGWPGFNGRDGDRILQTSKKAGVKRIDYFLATHYHTDHIGGIEQLADRMKIGTIVTHGPNTETGKNADAMNKAYEYALKTSGAKTLVVKPGDKIPLKGVDVHVVAARGDQIAAALPGAGKPNPHCAGVAEKNNDPTENARSIGFVLTHGKFRFIDLADLTHNKELKLACPNNLLGEVDLYLTNHHGLDTSNAMPLVHGLKPRVAVMNNGARKGGSPAAIATVRSSPGLEDLWMVHYSIAAGKEGNVPDSYIANLDENDEGFGIKVEAEPSGAMVVTNQRNKFTKTYAAKR
ncbi:MAG: MBL fold metallo-hydrolase [Bryobacteraceae bacterium]|nr:MBL fold metallo-hydrolase [Bryobacteraceae bacterium]